MCLFMGKVKATSSNAEILNTHIASITKSIDAVKPLMEKN